VTGDPPPGGREPGRFRRLEAAARERAEAVEKRAEAERQRHGSVAAVYEMVELDGEVGGGIIAGALAYRMFIWLLPLALVAVVGLGVAADAASESPGKIAGSAGLTGLVSSSVSNASTSQARWYALGIGIPILLLTTRSLLRALIGAHRLVWGQVRAAAPKPTLRATVQLLAALVALMVFAGLISTIRHRAPGLGILAAFLLALPFAGIWLLVTMRLPHRDADWKALVPGAIVFGLGAEVIHAISVYFLAPYSISKQGTYGALGTAAVLLLGLYFASRLIIACAVLNATLWSRRTPPGGDAT
jgi:membrane protein